LSRGLGPARTERAIETLLGVALAAILFGMMMLTVIDVAGRYFFNAPITAGYELTTVAMGVSVYLGLPLATAKREHITIGLLADRITGAGRRVQATLVDCFSAAVLAIFARELWLQAGKLDAENNLLLFLGIKVAPFVYVMSVLAGATVVVILVRLLFGRRTEGTSGSRVEASHR
jgi:TRAP-type C4-dicarboxylate transport system permease small subunit